MTPLQNGGYWKASSNLDDQLFIEQSKETRFFKKQFRLWWTSTCVALLVIFSLKVLNFKSFYAIFSNKKKETNIRKIKTCFPFWLRRHVSSTNVIIGSFALNFSHQQFIRCKEEINTQTKINFPILIACSFTNYRLSNCSFHKNFEIMSAAVFQINKRN